MDGCVTGLAFSRKGHSLVVTGSKGDLQLWDLTSNAGHLAPRRFQSPGGGKPVESVQSVIRQTPLVVIDDNVWAKKGSRLYEYSMNVGGKPKQVLQGHLSNIEAIAMIHDTRDLLSSSRDGLILTWGFPPPRHRTVKKGQKRDAIDRDSW